LRPSALHPPTRATPAPTKMMARVATAAALIASAVAQGRQSAHTATSVLYSPCALVLFMTGARTCAACFAQTSSRTRARPATCCSATPARSCRTCTSRSPLCSSPNRESSTDSHPFHNRRECLCNPGSMSHTTPRAGPWPVPAPRQGPTAARTPTELSTALC
jgi:hypothetical protein